MVASGIVALAVLDCRLEGQVLASTVAILCWFLDDSDRIVVHVS